MDVLYTTAVEQIQSLVYSGGIVQPCHLGNIVRSVSIHGGLNTACWQIRSQDLTDSVVAVWFDSSPLFLFGGRTAEESFVLQPAVAVARWAALGVRVFIFAAVIARYFPVALPIAGRACAPVWEASRLGGNGMRAVYEIAANCIECLTEQGVYVVHSVTPY